MEVFEMISEKGKPLLVIGGHKFCFQKVLANDIKRWICTSRKTSCKAYVKTESDKTIVVASMVEHNHNTDPEAILNRQVLSNSVKKSALDNTAEKPIKLIRKELRDNPAETITTHDIHRIRKNIHHARSSVLPNLPKNVVEFHEIIEKLELVTVKKEVFLLTNDKVNNIIIFSCRTNLQCLLHLEDLFVDGSFEYCPKFFLQIFTIHGYKNGHYVPLVFCLLPNKTKKNYMLAFQYVKEECEKIFRISLNPKTITVDFEVAIHKAILEVFPDIDIRGCRFHLFQSWYRKIQSLGLSTQYQKKHGDETEITQFLHYIFGLAFLDPHDVGDCFAIDFAEIKPEHEMIEKFCDYLVENYISEDSAFPPHIWAEHSSSLSKTTNACESFHNQYNQSFYTPHPNIHKFLNVLQEFQQDTYVKINSLDIVSRVYDCKVMAKKTFLNERIRQLSENEITKMQFIQIISRCFKPT